MSTNNKEFRGIYLYPVWVRIWHIINALLIITLIITGTSMQNSGTINHLIQFSTAVKIHNLSGIVLSVSYLLFLFGNILSENGKHYKIQLKGIFTRLKKQALYYSAGIFKGQNPPFPVTTESKFNPLQHFSYVIIMYICVVFVIVSGFGLLFPETIVDRFMGFSGLFLTDLLHIFVGFIISIFLLIHVYFCTIGHSPVSNFKSMINGWHEPH